MTDYDQTLRWYFPIKPTVLLNKYTKSGGEKFGKILFTRLYTFAIFSHKATKLSSYY